MEAVQARSIRELETAFAVSPVGIKGGVVSAPASVVADVVACVEQLPAASHALTP